MAAISAPYDHLYLTRWMFQQLRHCVCSLYGYNTLDILTRQDINRSCVSVVERGNSHFKENQLCLSSFMCKVSWKSYHESNDVQKKQMEIIPQVV